MDGELSALQEERRKIWERLEKCRREIAKCHEDLRRLHQQEEAILLRATEAETSAGNASPANQLPTLSELSSQGRRDSSYPQDVSFVGFNPTQPNRNKGTPRPPDTPSIIEMALQILSETKKTCPEGLTGRELVKMINDRWWPGVSQNSVLPKLHKCARDGYLFDRSFGRWRLIKR